MTVDPTETPGALHRLADRLGVLHRYTAASGATVTVAEHSLRALCTALGFPAGDDDAAARSLASWRDGRPALEPVLVALHDGAHDGALDVVWQAGPGRDATVHWRIVEEGGRVVDGVAAPAPAAAATDGAGAGAATAWRVPLAGVATGYHRLDIRSGAAAAACSLVVAPRRAHLPTAWDADARRDWAVTVQLYSLRSPRNWGIGDFTDLAVVGRHAAALGASAVGLNPVHALFPANPLHLSPYSPSSRAFLNPVYLDVEAVPGFASCEAARAVVDAPAFQARLQAARASVLVDYAAVWALKLEVLAALHDAFREHARRHPDSERALAYDAFERTGGEALRRFATFEALQRHFLDQGLGLAWPAWPAPYRRTDSPEVAAFAAASPAVGFAVWLQWETDRQLGAAAQAMRDAGMATGLYRDVAVGVDPNGAEAWADQTLLVAGASVGAPPDVYNPKGQDWGLTPFNPIALEQQGFEAFIDAVRANMRHAGAVRIDHVIGLQRLYWVPTGQGAAAGGYVAYPYADLMAIVALESQRQQCLVVGEDLGTVPEGFREDAMRRGMLSYRILMFEREHGEGAFLPPAAYPELAAAAASTHDLPTLAGLWRGGDLAWRRSLGLYPDDDAARRDVEARAGTRAAMAAALVAAGDLAPDSARRLADFDAPPPDAMAELVEAAHCYLARTPSRLLLVQIEDLAGEVEQMNLPGTVDAHPNWRRKLRRPLDELFADPAVQRFGKAVSQARATRRDG